MARRAFVLSLFVAAVLVPTASAAPPLPTSIASIGDSITRATDTCCWYGDHPAQSWSTGGGLFDGIRSHYERIRAVQPAIYGHNYNDARAGARMRNAPGQAQAVLTQRPRYVTVLMGANDVCTDSISMRTKRCNRRSYCPAALDPQRWAKR